MASWVAGIFAVTLFVEDLDAAKRFYDAVFGLPAVFEDANSTVYKFGDVLVNLLHTPAAPELVAPATVGGADAGVRAQFTIAVDDVDAKCAELAALGVELLNGPIDRPWACAPRASRILAATSGRSRTSASAEQGTHGGRRRGTGGFREGATLRI